MALSPRNAGEMVELPDGLEYEDLLCMPCKASAKKYAEPRSSNCTVCKRQFKTTVFQTGTDQPNHPNLCCNCVRDEARCQCCQNKLKIKKGCAVC